MFSYYIKTDQKQSFQYFNFYLKQHSLQKTNKFCTYVQIVGRKGIYESYLKTNSFDQYFQGG